MLLFQNKMVPAITNNIKTVTNIAPANTPQSLRPGTITSSSIQQIQVPGSRFTYVRLVSPTSGTGKFYLTDTQIEM